VKALNGVNFFVKEGEFAMLQSIGMTGRQLRQMLETEGPYYAAAAGAVSVLFTVGAVLPAAVLKTVEKQSIVERLRLTE